MLSIVGLTIDIEDATTQVVRLAEQLLIFECNVLYLEFSFKKVIQEINQQVLAEFLSEEALEAPIGKGVDVSTHNYLF